MEKLTTVNPEDIDRLSISYFELQLQIIRIIKNTPVLELNETIKFLEEEVYKQCPSLIPKDPRNK